MSLTKEDLLAIREIVHEVVDQELAPIKTDIAFMKHDISAINKKIEFIQEDISGLREEIIQIKNVVHIP